MSDIAGTRPRARDILLLLLLCAPLYLVHLGTNGLSDPDEPYYAVPAHEMLSSGTWTVPVFHGHPWFDKPILFYWIVLGAFLLFGVSETSARLGSVVAAVAGAISVYALGRRVCRQDRGALGAAIILATGLEYVILARAAVTDMTLTVCITLGMLAVVRWLVESRPRHALLAGLAFGAATLTKGPVGLLLPGLALAVYALLARRVELVRPRLLGAAASGYVIACAPWYLFMALRYPDLLMGTFLGEENLGRFLAPEHHAFPFYYVIVLFAGLLPWSGALPAAFAAALRPSQWSEERRAGGRPGPLFMLCWFGAVLLVFSLSASKLPSYILPAFPPAAILLGDFWAAAFLPADAPDRTRGARLSVGISVAIGAAGLVAMILVLRRTALAAAAPPAIAAAALLLAGAIASGAAVRRSSWRGLFAAQTAAGAAAILTLAVFALPAVEEFDSTRPLVRDLQARGIDHALVGVYRAKDVSLEFYLGRDLPLVHTPDELHRQVAGEPGGVWIVLTRDLDRIRSDDALSVETVLERPCRSAVRLGPRSPA